MADLLGSVAIIGVLVGLVYALVRSRRRTRAQSLRAPADIQTFQALIASHSLEDIQADVALRMEEPLRPCRIPPMGTFNGIGLMFHGNHAHDARTGSFVTTLWVTLIYIPLIPLGRYRIVYLGSETDIPLVSSSDHFFYLGRLPLRAFEWSIAAIVWAIFLAFLATEYHWF